MSKKQTRDAPGPVISGAGDASIASAALRLHPISHNRFHAHWSLCESLRTHGEPPETGELADNLVLRVFFLDREADKASHSCDWKDFSVSSYEDHGEFDLPKFAGRISAAIGRIDKGKRFSPLLRAGPIRLPEPPAPPNPKIPEEQMPSRQGESSKEENVPKVSKNSNEPKAKVDEGIPEKQKTTPNREISKGQKTSIDENTLTTAQTPHSCPNETPAKPEVDARPVNPAGWPEELQTKVPERTENPERDQLDERGITEKARQKLTASSEATPTRGNPVERLATTERFAPRSGTPIPAKDANASIQPEQELWSGHAPIELHAEFLLYGKLAPGTRLLIGQDVIEPDSEGMFTWRQTLRTFDQIWPLLRLALHPPVQAVGPGIEFFRDVEPASRLLEMTGALEVSGRLEDPEYATLLPEGLSIDEAGCFKFSRLLPEGAILMPGLSLVGD